MPGPEDKEAAYRAYIKEHSDLDLPTPELLFTKQKLADTLITQRKCSEAESLLRDIHPLISEQYGEKSPRSISCYRDLVRAVAGQLRHSELKPMLAEARRLVSEMQVSQFVEQQRRIETQWLDKIEHGMNEYQADLSERLEYMSQRFGSSRKL